jgi:chromosome partitioning protein
MAVVALVGRKGGCGKSTLATHIAAYFASRNIPVTLGDVDHQQSARTWLSRRPASAPAIGSWVGDATALARPPAGVINLVLDTPGGLHGFALSKVVMLADAIVLPVCASAFDRDATADCWAELRAQPRVKSGRCRVACVGMRMDGRTDAEQITRDWAASLGLEWLGSLRSAQVYVRAAENGLSIFDMPAKTTAADRSQWAPLLSWVKPYFASSKLQAAEKTSSQFAALQHPFATGANAQPRAAAVQTSPALTQSSQRAESDFSTRFAKLWGSLRLPWLPVRASESNLSHLSLRPSSFG